MVNLLQQFPTLITAGLSLRTDVIATDYPAPEWELVAILRGPAQIDLTSVAHGSTHQFIETATTTAGWIAGRYAVSIRAILNDDVYEVEAGDLKVSADLSTVTDVHDSRDHAQKTLDAIEAVIEGRASKDQDSYKINGRELVRTNIADLLALRKTYKAEVAANSSNGRHRRLMGRKVKVRF